MPPVKRKKGSSLRALEKARLRAQDWKVDTADYKLGKQIGHGAFATAYLATHLSKDRTVVVKRLDRAKQEQICQVHILRHAPQAWAQLWVNCRGAQGQPWQRPFRGAPRR